MSLRKCAALVRGGEGGWYRVNYGQIDEVEDATVESTAYTAAAAAAAKTLWSLHPKHSLQRRGNGSKHTSTDISQLVNKLPQWVAGFG